MDILAIVCTGRELDTDAQPVGEPHGKIGHGDVVSLRAAGWHIGPPDADGVRPAMCPRCAKPDPELVRICASLGKPGSARPDPVEEETLPGL